jgi:predicted RNA-binding protein with PIN domain
MPTLTHQQLDTQRHSFVHMLLTKRPQGSPRNTVTVVFDGYPAGFGEDLSSGNVHVLFACNRSADDRIKDIVQKAPLKKSMIVVTNDRAIQYAVRALGAKVLSVEDFLHKAHPSPSSGSTDTQKAQTGLKKNISDRDKRHINSELEDLWLKDADKKKKRDSS